MRTQLTALAVGLCLVAGMPAKADEERDYNGITYACTGVAESALEKRWRKYPLRLVFSGKGGGFVSDVAVNIQNSAGEAIFEARCEYEPWLVATLAPGKYKVTATALGQHSQSFSVSIAQGKQTLRHVRYKSINASCKDCK